MCVCVSDTNVYVVTNERRYEDNNNTLFYTCPIFHQYLSFLLRVYQTSISHICVMSSKRRQFSITIHTSNSKIWFSFQNNALLYTYMYICVCKQVCFCALYYKS